MTEPTTRAVAREERAAHRHRRLRRLAVVAAAALVVVLAVGTYAYARLDGNITRLDITGALGGSRPTTQSGPKQPLNILLIGSDQRVGLDTTMYGKDTVEGGAHSDTNMLVHVSADRSWAMVVSIPRDSMVKSPEDCTNPSSPVDQVRQWNANFNKGGPACVIRTLEANTDVFVNHFAVVNFNGFRDMVDALGGVEVCLKQDVKDRDSQFHLSAGRHRVDGTTALGYVRVRHALGDGSDLGRIKRQQAFMTSVIQEATRTSLLLRPDRLYGFLDAATRSLTTDSELTVGAMKDLAQAVAGIGLSNIEFFTVPTDQYEPDHNRVQWAPAAEQLWQAMREDRQPGAKPKATPTPTSTEALTVSPADIDVKVVNDSGTEGYARQAAKALLAQGFRTAEPVGGTPTAGGARVLFSPAHREAARTVAAAFPGAELVEDPAAGASVVVHLGQGSPVVVAVPNRVGATPLPEQTITLPPSEGATSVVTGRKADTDICS